ncbi:hypothetical protein [Leptolyngbya sp. NIES-2104]|uniref:hypothetical protein n=1 Tax=Leptolyngbya sp. NIES-2104 TaxID=1552121 RepID=UPI0006EC851E|nr:hypothetical protein [Leptolyngbya sp. NIES-2104]GAP99121.1 hypothetical protein NIES2104_56790 [Leptolyngbya sp. NIES-2104]
MSQKIQIKRSVQQTGAPTNLAPGEMAYSAVSKKLFIGEDDGTPETIGGSGAFVTHQDLGNAIDEAIADLVIDGGTY